jgi:hypothetical protein
VLFRSHASGQAWGQLLNHGSDELLADLALCEVVCAEAAVLREALGKRVSLPATLPQALLVEPDNRTFEALNIRFEGEPPRTFDEQWEKLYEAFARERIGGIEQDLRAKIAGSRALLERRVRACCAALELDPNTVLAEGVNALEGNVGQKLRRAPAVVRWHAERIATEREPWIAALAGASASRLRQAAPEGASWAISTGCGIQIEGEDGNRAMACGMGHVPEISARFLHFMTR